MSSQPFFSIITPNYNTEEFLSECLESVAKQVFTDYEHILIDDFSPNKYHKNSFKQIITETKSAFPNYKNKLLILENQANRGVSVSRNKCLDIAKGQFFIFLDADDKLTPGFLQGLYDELLLDTPNWQKTIYNQYNIQGFNSTTGLPNPKPLVVQKPKNPNITKELVFFSITNPALVIHRNCLQYIRYKEGLQFGEEPELVFKLHSLHGKRFKIKPLLTHGYLYRQHQNQFSTEFSNKESSNYLDILSTIDTSHFNTIQKHLLRLAKTRYKLYSEPTLKNIILVKSLTFYCKLLSGWWL
jgi:glycosyltransferase involved in cell wall biosynthesis